MTFHFIVAGKQGESLPANHMNGLAPRRNFLRRSVVLTCLAGLVVPGLVLSGCGGADDEPTPTPASTPTVVLAAPSATPSFERWNNIPLYPDLVATEQADCFGLISAFNRSDAYNDIVNVRDAVKRRNAESACFVTSTDSDTLAAFYDKALEADGWSVLPQSVDGPGSVAFGVSRKNGLELGFVGFGELRGQQLVQIGFRPGP